MKGVRFHDSKLKLDFSKSKSLMKMLTGRGGTEKRTTIV